MKKVSTRRYIIGVLVLIPLMVLFYQFSSGRILTFIVVSNSMYPALLVNERVLVEVSEDYIPERGDIIAFQNPDQNDRVPVVKRVIGVPGDVVEVRRGILYVNGQREREYEADKIRIMTGDRKFFVEPRSVFVLGDNRNYSYDSLDFGTVPYSEIIGKITHIYWPPGQMRKVE